MLYIVWSLLGQTCDFELYKWTKTPIENKVLTPHNICLQRLACFFLLCFLMHCILNPYNKKRKYSQIPAESTPQLNLSPALVPFKPCSALGGCKRAGRRVAGHLCTLLKALKDAQHVYPPRYKQQRERLRHKGTPARMRWSSGGDEWKCVRASLCLCVHTIDRQLNPINGH